MWHASLSWLRLATPACLLLEGDTHMRNANFLILLATLFIATAAQGEDLKQLTFITENLPPYNFQVDGVPQGTSVDLLLTALKEVHAGVKRSDIHVMPWARGYRIALHRRNVVLFSTAKTQHRLNLFQWVGPINQIQTEVLAKKSLHIKISSPKDMEKYAIGVVRDDVGEQLLRAQGIPESRISIETDGANLARMLGRGHVDLWAYDGFAARWFLKQVGLDPSQYETVYTLHQGEQYYAVSKSTSPALVKALQEAIDHVKQENGGATYRAIFDRYK